MEGGAEACHLRNGCQGLFTRGHDTARTCKSRAQQILPRGEAGLFAKDAMEIGIPYAEFLCEGLQVHILALVLARCLSARRTTSSILDGFLAAFGNSAQSPSSSCAVFANPGIVY